MKNILVIALFLSVKLFSQINPPDLRCVEVLTNGNVKLTWIPPADPSGVFSSYEIYTSIAANGPYNNVGSVGALVLTTFTHVTIPPGANGQSFYYYIKIKFGAGGASTTVPSDTLRSIHVNVTQASPALNILFNKIHLPALNSTSGTYTVAKEFPLGTWSNIGVTANTNYGDTVSVCSASLNYQVSVSDNSGCSSISNVFGNVFSDSKIPDAPIIDSISVLPNGNTVLAWHIPPDKDISKYRIYQKISGINTAIDSVVGRNNTIYTFTTTAANFSTIALFVASMDSCGKLSLFDVRPTTMFLLADYNTCDYSTVLSWNDYVGMPGGLLEYRIYYSVNGSAFVRVGSTTTTSFVHKKVDPSQNICYFIRAVNKTQTITSSSNRYCFFTTQALAANYVYIRSASIIDKNKAEIKMYLDLSKQSKGIELTRSEDGLNYTSIAFLPFNGSAMYSYTDENIYSQTTSYYYRAVIHDSCGNPRGKSAPHKTILLKVDNDKEMLFNKKITWTNYKGFDAGVSGYNIYRIINDTQSPSPVGQVVSDSTFTDNLEDEASNGSKIEYLVEAVESLGNMYGFKETALSNKEQVYIEGRIYIPTAFAPHGRNKIWLPVTHFVDKTDYNLRVFNKWGNKLFETTDDTHGWDGKDATSDVYVYLITYKNSRGEYLELKGTFTFL